LVKLFKLYEFRGVTITKGFLHYVWDDQGRKYVDAHTGYGVAFLGHSNPKVVSALIDQALRILTVAQSFKTPIEEELERALDPIAPPGAEVFLFQNSGAEGVELALKLAWAFTGRRKVVAFKGSFHGRTLGALSVTWEPKYRSGFPLLEDVVFLDFNADPKELEERFPDDAAAVILETVQGEGGVVPAKGEFVRAVESLARKTGALFIADEIQCGFGRTGRNWAFEEFGVKPDIVVAGKAIGAGFPVSVVFTREEIARSLLGGRHGSTFAANPLALASVKAAAEAYVEDSVPRRVAEVSGKLLSALESRVAGLRPVREVRGKGLMVGVELRFPPTQVLKCMQERGVLALRAGSTVVRLLPPYTVLDDDEAVEAMVSSVEECACREHGC